MRPNAISILIFFLAALCNSLFAQIQTIDSLQKVLQTQKEDTNKVNTLVRLSRLFLYNNDSQNGIKCGNESLSLSEKLNFKGGEGKAYQCLGIVFFQQGNYAAALKNLFACLKIFEELQNKADIAGTRQFIGAVYVQQGNNSEALKNIQVALQLREEISDSESIAQSLNSLGAIYRSKGDYTEALQKHFAALKIVTALGDKVTTNWSLPYCYSSIAIDYEQQGNKANEDGDKVTAVNKYTEAIKNYFLSLKKWEETNRKDAIAAIDIDIGNINVKLGKLSSARDYLKTGLRLSTESMNKEDLRYCYYSLSCLDTVEGNYKQAYEHYIMFITYRDSLINEESEKKSVQAQMQYEFDKKEDSTKALQDKKDALTNAEISRQRVVRNFSVSGVLAVLSLGGFVFYNFRKRKKLESQQALSNERLRISRELHDDIGSTLGSIAVYSDVAKNRSVKNENSVEVLSKIGNASRELIEKMSDIVWSLNPDNETFEQLQNRMQGFAAMILTPRNISIEFKTDDELKSIRLTSEQRKNIFLVFKEAVHNIVKYAECKNVFISLIKSNNNLSLLIKDDGKGFDSDNTVAYNGNGIKNMKARAEDISASFNINSSINEGSTIELNLIL